MSSHEPELYKMCTSLKRRKEFPVQLEAELNPSDRDVACNWETLVLCRVHFGNAGFGSSHWMLSSSASQATT